MVLDHICDSWSGSAWSERQGALVSKAQYKGEDIWLIKPQEFMNLSGRAIRSLLKFYKIKLSELVVAHDELDLSFGEIRLKLGGGDAGHNGLRSIREELGSGEYYRVRLGIGRPAETRMSVSAWVLQKFSSDERQMVESLVDRGVQGLELLSEKGLKEAQTFMHTVKK